MSSDTSVPIYLLLHVCVCVLSGAVPGPESLLFSSAPKDPLQVPPIGNLLQTLSPAELEEVRRNCKNSTQCGHDTLTSSIPELGQWTLRAEMQFQNLALIKGKLMYALLKKHICVFL